MVSKNEELKKVYKFCANHAAALDIRLENRDSILFILLNKMWDPLKNFNWTVDFDMVIIVWVNRSPNSGP